MAQTSERVTPRVRRGTPEDEGFLWDMLYEAACWCPEGPKPERGEIFSNPSLTLYVDGWGRIGDAAVIVIDPGSDKKVGAAWYRLMAPEDPGYGFVDASTPEVSIGVVPRFRGRGAGGALLDGLMSTAREQGFGALSLSVEHDNPAVRLYRRKGFAKLFDAGGSGTMRLDLAGSAGGTPQKPLLTLTLLEEPMAVCRLDTEMEVPTWATAASLFSVTRTADELSVVCPEGFVPVEARCEKGWRAFKLEGPFEFSEVGILSAVAASLAEAGVAIFAVSTFDTDYVLVKEEELNLAAHALRGWGHEVRNLRVREG